MGINRQCTDVRMDGWADPPWSSAQPACHHRWQWEAQSAPQPENVFCPQKSHLSCESHAGVSAHGQLPTAITPPVSLCQQQHQLCTGAELHPHWGKLQILFPSLEGDAIQGRSFPGLFLWPYLSQLGLYLGAPASLLLAPPSNSVQREEECTCWGGRDASVCKMCRGCVKYVVVSACVRVHVSAGMRACVCLQGFMRSSVRVF